MIANDWEMKFGAHELVVGEHERFCLHVATKDVDLPEAVKSAEPCQSLAMQPDLLLDRSGLDVAA